MELNDYILRLEAALPDLVIRSAEPVTMGWDSFALVVNGDLIARFARRPDVARSLRRERALLPELAPTLPAAVPHFTTFDDAGPANDERGDPATLPFVVYPLLPGAPLDTTLDTTPGAAPLPDAMADTLAPQLAAFLGALHRFPLSRAQALGVAGDPSAARWRDEYRALYTMFRERTFPLLDARRRAWANALWEGFLDDDARFRFDCALIHRDLGCEHILVDPAAHSLTGVIDWGDASMGDPAMDFVGLLTALGPAFVERVLRHYPLPTDSAFWGRMRFYAAIIPFYFLNIGALEGDQARIAEGLALLDTRIE